MIQRLVCLLSVLALVAAESGPIALTYDTWDAEVTNSGTAVFVKFFAPWCGHCKKLAPVWNTLAEMHNTRAPQLAKVANVDCTLERDLCTRHSITGYPSLVLFRGTMKEHYDGGRSLEALDKYLTETLSKSRDSLAGTKTGGAAPSLYTNGLYVGTVSTFSSLVASGFSFVMFYAPWCGHSKRLLPTWEELAKSFQSSQGVHIVGVDCTAETVLCSQYGIRAYPSLFPFVNGNQGDKYTGARTLEALATFVSSSSGSAPPSTHTDSIAGIPREGHVLVLGEKTFTLGVSSGWSFVKFYAPWCGHCKKMAPAWSDLAARYANSPDIKIAKVDCTESGSLCADHGVKGYPTLLLFKNGVQVDKYTNGRDLQSFVSYIELHTKSIGHQEL